MNRYSEASLIADLNKKIEDMRLVMLEAQRLLRSGANGAITDTVWSDTKENTTLYELMYTYTDEMS